MRVFAGSLLFLTVLVLMSAFIGANDTGLEIKTDKDIYFSGESGNIIVKIDNLGKVGRADILVEIMTSEGKFVDTLILETDIPKYRYVVKNEKQSVQIIDEESISYLSPDKTVVRKLPFRVPSGLPSGMYILRAMVSYDGNEIVKEKTIEIINNWSGADMILIIYVLLISFSIYLMRFRKVAPTDL